VKPPTILQMTQRVVAAGRGIGGPPPMWDATLSAFYGLKLSPDNIRRICRATRRSSASFVVGRPFRQLWARVGRRGRKSFHAALIVVYEALFGGHGRYLIPGERGLAAVISKDLAGTKVVTGFCLLILDALGFRYSTSRVGAVDLIDIEGAELSIACFACNAEAPRGWPIAVVVLDEIAFWATSDRYRDPDSEIAAAVRPAMAQFHEPKLIGISSPFGKQGVHYDTVEAALGNDADLDVLAVQGPTWEWNPSISEERTHQLERDERVWRREYEATPQQSTSAAFDSGSVDISFRTLPVDTVRGIEVGVIDLSSGRGDAATWGVGCWAFSPQVPRHLVRYETAPISRRDEWGNQERRRVEVPVRDAQGRPVPNPDWRAPAPPLLVLDSIQGEEGAFWSGVPADALVDKMAATFRGRVQVVVGDQREGFFAEAEFRRHGLRFVALPWTQPNKVDAVARLRRWLADRQLVFPDQPEPPRLRKQLHEFEERLLPSGLLGYGARRGEHDDFASLAMTASMADAAGLIPMSPYQRPRPRRDLSLLAKFF